MEYNLNDAIKVLSEFAGYVKRFNQHLTTKYKLNDIPFNVKGQFFPRSGFENIDDFDVKYHFHGRGCTLDWSGIDIRFDIDVSTIHEIMISSFGIVRFVKTNPLFRQSDVIDYSQEKMTSVLELLEANGMLMTRKPADLGSFHINEQWYEAYKGGKEFSGSNKNDSDWI